LALFQILEQFKKQCLEPLPSQKLKKTKQNKKDGPENFRKKLYHSYKSMFLPVLLNKNS
jgi:hypothetical protein